MDAQQKRRRTGRLIAGLIVVVLLYVASSGPMKCILFTGHVNMEMVNGVPTTRITVDRGVWPKLYAPLAWIGDQAWGAPLAWYWQQFPISHQVHPPDAADFPVPPGGRPGMGDP